MKKQSSNNKKLTMYVLGTIIILLIYIVIKSIMITSYNSNLKAVKKMYDNNIIAEKITINKVRATQFVFLDDELKISINYDTFLKEGDTFNVVNTDGVKYTIKKEEVEDKTDYYQILSDVDKIYKDKVSIFTPFSTLKQRLKSFIKLKKQKDLDLIAALEGNSFKGYTYKKDNKYVFIFNSKKGSIKLTFEGKNLSYDYLVSLLGTLQYD